jgi:hypothetical protein
MNYRGHEIQTVYYPEQCQEFHNAIKEGDCSKAYWLHIAPIYKSYEMIQSEVRMIDLVEDHKAEMKRIDEMPADMLLMEMKFKYGVK